MNGKIICGTLVALCISVFSATAMTKIIENDNKIFYILATYTLEGKTLPQETNVSSQETAWNNTSYDNASDDISDGSYSNFFNLLSENISIICSTDWCAPSLELKAQLNALQETIQENFHLISQKEQQQDQECQQVIASLKTSISPLKLHVFLAQIQQELATLKSNAQPQSTRTNYYLALQQKAKNCLTLTRDTFTSLMAFVADNLIK